MENETSHENGEEVKAPMTPEPTPSPVHETPSPMTDVSKSSPYGPIVGIIIIVILIILAGFYFWGGTIEDSYNTELETGEEQMEEVMEEDGIDTSGDSLEGGDAALSESNEIEDIEADLDSTDLDSFDEGFEDLDAEFAQ